MHISSSSLRLERKLTGAVAVVCYMRPCTYVRQQQPLSGASLPPFRRVDCRLALRFRKSLANPAILSPAVRSLAWRITNDQESLCIRNASKSSLKLVSGFLAGTTLDAANNGSLRGLQQPFQRKAVMRCKSLEFGIDVVQDPPKQELSGNRNNLCLKTNTLKVA